jgi:hypothetical protein
MSYPVISGQQKLCPSARCDEGALLVGIIGIEGKVAYISPALRVDHEFTEEAWRGSAPEQRFRFAAPCRESSCVHWTGTRCGVIDAALLAAEATQTRQCASSPLPRCGIRAQCRWFAQTGPDACSTCPFLFNYIWPEVDSGQSSKFETKRGEQACQKTEQGTNLKS